MTPHVVRAATALALATLGLTTPSSSAVAQDAPPGWIGISYEVQRTREGRARGTRIVVTDVRAGSPAAEAGLRAGDRLIRINDIQRADEFQDLPARLRLRVGEPVRIRLVRDGRQVDVRLRAAERPVEMVAQQPLGWSFQTDSMVETMFRAMDSLRIRLVESRGQDLRLASPQSDRGGRFRVVVGGDRGAVRAPFEFFVFRGQQHDSLRLEMDELNNLISDLRVREEARVREISSGSAGRASRVEVQDEQLARLRRAIEDGVRRSARLRASMAEAARETAGLDYTYRTSDVSPVVVPDPDVRPFRPLTPYLLGSTRVAGAQVVDLRPELAEYFAVEGGVLIVDVAPRTPAAIAGIRPGDVVTRLDQVSVRSVEDLRFGVSQSDETLPITLIRQGSSIQVLLRR